MGGKNILEGSPAHPTGCYSCLSVSFTSKTLKDTEVGFTAQLETENLGNSQPRYPQQVCYLQQMRASPWKCSQLYDGHEHKEELRVLENIISRIWSVMGEGRGKQNQLFSKPSLGFEALLKWGTVFHPVLPSWQLGWTQTEYWVPTFELQLLNTIQS